MHHTTLKCSTSLQGQWWAAACPPPHLPSLARERKESTPRRDKCAFSHGKESSRVELRCKSITPAETLPKFSLRKRHFFGTVTVCEEGLVTCLVLGRLEYFILIYISQNCRHVGWKEPLKVTKCDLLFKCNCHHHQVRSPWLYLAESWQGCRSYSLFGYLLHAPPSTEIFPVQSEYLHLKKKKSKW